MRFYLVLLLLLVATGMLVNPCAKGALLLTVFTSQGNTQRSSAPLRLTTEVIKQTYCEGPDPDLVSLRLLLQLSLTNTSAETMILEKGINKVPLIKVSNTLEDALAGRVQNTYEITIISSNRLPESLPDSPTSDLFILLPPGGVYKTVTDIMIPVPRSKVILSSVSPGNHFIRIAAWTWDGKQDQAKALRTKWQQKGNLISETLISEPMNLVVIANPRPEDCHCQRSGISEGRAVAIANKNMGTVDMTMYKLITFDNGCEWHVVYEPKRSKINNKAVEYIIDKKSEKILQTLYQ